MPFSLPIKTIEYWQQRALKPVNDEQMNMMEKRLAGSAPQSYRDFMQTYGAVEFDDDIDCRFDYVYRFPDRTELRSNVISFIKTPQSTLQYYEGLQQDHKINLPAHLLPFGMDYGQGELLIEFGRKTQRIFYWDFDSHDWESGKTRIGFVADDFYEFINNLRGFDD